MFVGGGLLVYKKGFTLIELLAVIVILAIIALIATPIILNIIEDSRRQAVLRSGELYLEGVKEEIARKNLTSEFSPESCEIQSDGNLVCDGVTLTVETSGKRPSGGTITFENGKVTDVNNMVLGDYTLETDDDGNLRIKEGTSEETGGSTSSDTTPPEIESVDVVGGTITVTAHDDGGGKLQYNFGDGKDYVDSATATVEESGTYNITVKDEAGNVSETWPVIIDIEANCTVAYKPTTPNAPEIKDGLTPVKWDNDQKAWVITTTDDKDWYDYSKQEWANAVILNDNVSKNKGETLTVPTSESATTDVKAMLVWIPRYEYRIEDTYGKCGKSATLPGAIDIQFISKEQKEPSSNEYHINTAFWWDNNSNGDREEGEELSGLWVGKFETTGTEESPTILPNLQSLTNQNISAQFSISRLFETKYGISFDSHMAKNSEWGAVAYLSQSKYGKYGNSSYEKANKEVYINNSSDKYTGRSGGTPSASDSSAGTCKYDVIDDRGSGQGQCGGGASTTGNITGVYDMSGGAWEYVMGNYNGTIQFDVFSKLPDSKYYDKYTSTTATQACSGGVCYGHALSETSGWYNDYADSISSASPWFVRGGYCSDASGAGVFHFTYGIGPGFGSLSFRVVLAAA